MDLLPDEVLDMVFQYLTTPELLSVCARVNQRWQRIVKMRSLALRQDGDEKNLHRGIRAVLLIISPIDLLATLADITTKASHLRELSAHAPVPFHEMHMAALDMLPHLAHLDVFMRLRLLYKRFAPLLKRLRTLVANDSFAPGLLRELAAGSQLVALHMYGRAVHYPRRELLAVLRDRAPYLQELTLRCNELPDSAYDVIGDCYALRELRLYSCWLLTAAGAAAVCRPQHVRVLHVTGARLVRHQALADTLAELQHGLHELVLSNGWFSDDHVRLVARRAPDLRLLELWHCKLTVAGVEALASSLRRLEQLEVDLTLSQYLLRKLACHPFLQQVRCKPDIEGQYVQHLEDHPLQYVDGLRVVTIQASYARKYFRPEGDGFRSTLFYFWTRNVPLKPLPSHTRPTYAPYDELFY